MFPNVLTVIIGNGNDWSSNRDGPANVQHVPRINERERERVSERECVCERETETDRVRVRELSIDMKIKVVQHVPRESEFECGKRMKYIINVLQFIMM